LAQILSPDEAEDVEADAAAAEVEAELTFSPWKGM